MLSIITMRENKLHKMPNRIPLILVYLFQLGHQNCRGSGSIPCRICRQRVAGRTTLSHHHHPPQNDNLMYQLKDKYPNFEVGLKCILMVFPYLLLCSYINENAI